MEVLTDPVHYADLALAFARYMKENEAFGLLTHEVKYTTQQHSKQVPLSLQAAEQRLLRAIDAYFAGSRMPTTITSTTTGPPSEFAQWFN
jgi:hypothetical protein